MLCSETLGWRFGAAPYRQDFFGFMILKKMGPWVRNTIFLEFEIFRIFKNSHILYHQHLSELALFFKICR